jgi:mannitol-1-phosphate 5-dehydrogenase
MRVVVIGPGRIGCGYLAPLFLSQGFEVILAARNELCAARIRRQPSFGVLVTELQAASGNGNGTGERTHAQPHPTTSVFETPPAVAVGTREFADAIAEADLVCTSVGVGQVASVARPLARALAVRPSHRPLDVWTIENGDCAPQLEAGVRRVAEAERLMLPPVGFAGAVARVAVARGSWEAAAAPEFVGDSFRSLLVDQRPLLNGIPSLPGVRGTDSYHAHLLEKLYVFSAGHAICAYLGWLRGHATVAGAAADPYLRPIIAGSMLDARRALIAAHPSLGSDLHGPLAEALMRFADPELADPIARVAREPIRKLAPGDRLVGPAELIRSTTGRVSGYFALAVAGALLYKNGEERQSRELQCRLREGGVMSVLESVCGLPPGDPFAAAVAARYRAFIITPDETVFPPVHASSVPPVPVPSSGATARRSLNALLATALGPR